MRFPYRALNGDTVRLTKKAGTYEDIPITEAITFNCIDDVIAYARSRRSEFVRNDTKFKLVPQFDGIVLTRLVIMRPVA